MNCLLTTIYKFTKRVLLITGRKDMKYSMEYIIPSDMILGYDINRRNSSSISFKRYETKFKTGYSTGWYIYRTILRDSIFVEYLIVPVADKIIDSLF